MIPPPDHSPEKHGAAVSYACSVIVTSLPLFNIGNGEGFVNQGFDVNAVLGSLADQLHQFYADRVLVDGLSQVVCHD